VLPIASSPRLLMKYVRNTLSPSRKNTFVAVPLIDVGSLCRSVCHGITRASPSPFAPFTACGKKVAGESISEREMHRES